MNYIFNISFLVALFMFILYVLFDYVSGIMFQFWDGLTGHLKYLYQEGRAGVTAVCFVANRWDLSPGSSVQV